jgi:N-acyl-D-aspartate/D-glutamate deacylase
MRGELREGLEAGCVGYSTGLIYEPGRYARTEELLDLAAVMSEIGGLYATHMRDEGQGLLDSVRGKPSPSAKGRASPSRSPTTRRPAVRAGDW